MSVASAKAPERSHWNAAGILFGGHLSGHVVLFLSAPFLAFLFGPEAFGIFGQLATVMAVLQPLATGRLEQALVIPVSDRRASLRVSIGIGTSLTVALFSFLVCLLVTDHPMWWLLPLGIIADSWAQFLHHWQLRNRHFAFASACNGGRGVLMAGLQVCLYPLHAFGLVIGRIAADLLQIIAVSCKSRPRLTLSLRLWCREWAAVRPFIFFQSPQTCLSTVAASLPIFFFGWYFSVEMVGAFFLVTRLLFAPLRLISVSIGQGMLPFLVSEYERSAMFHSTVRRIFLVAAPTAILVALLGPWACGFMGPAWEEAGLMIPLLMPWVFVAALAAPASAMIAALNWQRQDLYFETILLLIRAMALLIGCESGSAFLALFMYAMVGGVSGPLRIYLVDRYARRQGKLNAA